MIGEVRLYDEGAGDIDLADIAGYLAGQLPRTRIEIKDSPLAGLEPDITLDLARRLAAAKVYQPGEPVAPDQEPLPGEIAFEKRRIEGKTRAFGVLYDGFLLARLFGLVLPREAPRRAVDIVFTNRLFGTWDDANKRYHLRTSVYGVPSLVSTTGLIEAPARTREYYLLKQQYERLGRDLTELKDVFRGQFLDYGDSRLTGVAGGYALQAVFYALAGHPFCEDASCRLYNAHWQAELIHAHIESGELCQRHAGMLR